MEKSIFCSTMFFEDKTLIKEFMGCSKMTSYNFKGVKSVKSTLVIQAIIFYIC